MIVSPFSCVVVIECVCPVTLAERAREKMAVVRKNMAFPTIGGILRGAMESRLAGKGGGGAG
jgi:hypothetical protein